MPADTQKKVKPKEKAKVEASNKATWFRTVCKLAAMGISDSSIAAKLGLSPVQFSDLANTEVNGVKPVRQAIDEARAKFEIDRVLIKDAILNDAETPNSLRYKIAREDLKTLEAWAPATRTVKVQMEKSSSEFNFEAFSASDLANIAAQSAGSDNQSGENA